MSSLSELETLAADLNRNAIAVSVYCEQQGYQQKSFGAVEPTTLLPSDAPERLQAARGSIQEAALKITQLASDPREFLNSFQVEVCPPDMCGRFIY